MYIDFTHKLIRFSLIKSIVCWYFVKQGRKNDPGAAAPDPAPRRVAGGQVKTHLPPLPGGWAAPLAVKRPEARRLRQLRPRQPLDSAGQPLQLLLFAKHQKPLTLLLLPDKKKRNAAAFRSAGGGVAGAVGGSLARSTPGAAGGQVRAGRGYGASAANRPRSSLRAAW